MEQAAESVLCDDTVFLISLLKNKTYLKLTAKHIFSFRERMASKEAFPCGTQMTLNICTNHEMRLPRYLS